MARSSRIRMPSSSGPMLRRIDGKSIDLSNESAAFQKIGINVESVYFYNQDFGNSKRRPLSAVLLNVFFQLDPGENLLSAIIPLDVVPQAVRSTDSTAEQSASSAPPGQTESNDVSQIEIFGNFPSRDEYIRVESQTETKTRPQGSSSENIDAKGASLVISLSPQRRRLDGLTTLSWVFQSKVGALFPSNIQLLVVIAGPEGSTGDGSDSQRDSFPFRLRLLNQLHLRSTRGARTLFFSSWMFELLHSHEGWYFDIKEPYNPKLAEDALEQINGKRQGTAPTIGLYAAVLKSMSDQPEVSPGDAQ